MSSLPLFFDGTDDVVRASSLCHEAQKFVVLQSKKPMTRKLLPLPSALLLPE